MGRSSITPGIRLYRSPDFEALSKAWVEGYQERIKQQDPLTPETIIVHSQAMARYMNRSLTQKLGVTALINYLLPEEWENRVREALLDSRSKAQPFPHSKNPYDPDCLRWILYLILTHPHYQDILPTLPIPGNHPFAGSGEDRPMKAGLSAYQLSETMATLYNEYLFFREEKLWEWDDQIKIPNPDPNWQRWLWQTLRRHLPHPHRLEELAQIKEVLKTSTAVDLPEHLTIFGVSYLPPYYLELVNGLKKFISIDYYFLDTTRPWENIRVTKPAFLKKMNELSNAYLDQIEKWNWEEISLPPQTSSGNPQGVLPFIKSFFNQGTTTLTDQGAYPDFQIHNCPNRHREVEVVKTQILSLLEDNKLNPELTLDKILILAPDILIYEDYITSVFSADPTLPFYIIDRNQKHTNSVIRALLTVMNLFHSDWELSLVRGVLTLDIIQAVQNWTSEDLLYIERWLNQLGVKRGRGGRVDDLPHHDLEKYGWNEGIRRTLFHLALPEGIVKSGGMQTDFHGSRAQSLGKVIYLIQKLLALDRKFQQPTDVDGWLDRVEELVITLYQPEREYLHPPHTRKDYAGFKRQVQNLKKRIAWANASLADMKTSMSAEETQREDDQSNLSRKMDLLTFTEILKQNLEETEHLREGSHRGILCGSFLPLRTIPATATFMIGMIRDEFPRHDRQSHFNLIFEDPRPGDPSQKKRDCLLMIETLFATQSYLGITFSTNANDQISTPSILIDELLNLLTQRSGIDFQSKIVHHPLLPFLAPIRKGEGEEGKEGQETLPSRFSYDPEDYRSAVARERPKPQENDPSPLTTTFTTVDSLNAMLDAIHNQNSQGMPDAKPVNHASLIFFNQAMKHFYPKEQDNSLNSPNSSNKEEIKIAWGAVKSFFIDAPRFFLRQIMKMDLSHELGPEDDGETFVLDGLNEYQLVVETIKEKRGSGGEAIQEGWIPSSVILEDPRFPPGTPGHNKTARLNWSLHKLQKNLTEVCTAIGADPQSFFTGEPLIVETILPNHDFDQAWGERPIRIEGVVENTQWIQDTLHHLVCFRLRITAHDIFQAWLDHLLLHRVSPKTKTWLIGEEIFFFPPLASPDNPKEDPLSWTNFLNAKMLAYVAVYVAGHSQGLPIYKNLSYAFHEYQVKGLAQKEKGVSATRFAFKADDWDPSVSPYANYLWGEDVVGTLTLSPTQTIALSDLYHNLWEPLYQCLKKFTP